MLGDRNKRRSVANFFLYTHLPIPDGSISWTITNDRRQAIGLFCSSQLLPVGDVRDHYFVTGRTNQYVLTGRNNIYEAVVRNNAYIVSNREIVYTVNGREVAYIVIARINEYQIEE